ncbi:hypothetical protein Dimus_024965 [Dionaea muscipula]
MFRSKSNGVVSPILCKKHPKHRQSPGVCSLCLTEKLSKLSRNTNYKAAAAARVISSSCPSSSSSSLSSLHSSDISSHGSPSSDVRGTALDAIILRKSRSLAFVCGGGRVGWEVTIRDHGKKKKKGMFSLRFLRPRRKKDA